MVRQIVVDGNIGGFIQGQVLSDRSQIAEYFVAILNEGRSRTVHPTNDFVLKFVDKVFPDHSTEGDCDRECQVIELIEAELASA